MTLMSSCAPRADARRVGTDRRIMQQAQHRIAEAHLVVEEIVDEPQIARDGAKQRRPHRIQCAEQPADRVVEVRDLRRPEIVGHVAPVRVPRRQVATRMPEFLQVDGAGVLRRFGPERRVAARAAGAGDMVAALDVVGQREERLGRRGRAVDQALVEPVVGHDREAVSAERCAQRLRERAGIGGQANRHRFDPRRRLPHVPMPEK